MVALTPTHQALATRLGATIRLLRKRKGWKQEVLAREAGYGSRSAIASIEAGWVLPSLEKMLDLAQALGVRPNDLLETATTAADPAPAGLVPLPTWSTKDRRALQRSLRQLMAELEEVNPRA